MSVSVLIPYGPGDPHRDRAFEWVERRWRGLTDYEVIVERAPGTETDDFPHAALINRAAARASGDVLIVADADTAFASDWAHAAVNAVEQGAPWALPRHYAALLPESSARVVASDPLGPMPPFEVDWCGDSISYAGLVVVPRRAFEVTGGYSIAVAGWGGDDICFAAKLETLWGSHVRIEGSAMHLWHPRPYHEHQREEWEAVMRRYLDAWGDPPAMRALIAETR